MRPLLKGRFPHSVGEMSQSDKGGRPCHGGGKAVGGSLLTRWFEVGRLRVSALALTEDALRPRAEFHSATEPPTLQFQQRVGSNS